MEETVGIVGVEVGVRLVMVLEGKMMVLEGKMVMREGLGTEEVRVGVRVRELSGRRLGGGADSQ